MKKLMWVSGSLVLILSLALFITGRMEKPALTSEQIYEDVPLRATPAQVFAILDSKHIEYFQYKVDPDGKRFIIARSRGSKWSLVREDHSVTFSFDGTAHLVSKEPHTWLTGP